MRHKGQKAITGLIKSSIIAIMLYSAWLTMPNAAQAACVRAQPTVTVTPASQGICVGGSTTFNVSVTNNDSKVGGGGTCADEVFTFTATSSNVNFTLSYSPTTVSLPMGNVGSSTLTVTNPSQVNGTTTTITVTITSPNHTNQNGNIAPTVTVIHPTGITFNPTSGNTGTAVTISGAGFGTTQGTGDAKFNGTSSTETGWNNTTINTTVPGGATTGTISVTNQYGCTGTSAGTFTVTAPNQRPSITSTAPTTASEAVLYTYNITASDPESNPITLAKSAGDTCGGTLVDNLNGTGTYTFTPSETQGGTTCVVGVVASDAGGAGTPQNTTVTISETNQTPSVGGDTVSSLRQGQAGTINVSATDPDLANTIPQAQVRVERNGGTCTGTVTGLPTTYGNGSFTGTFGFTPAVGDGLSCTILYRACDNNGTPACSANRTLTVTIDQNDAPTMSGTATITVAEGAVSGNLTATGSDVDTYCPGAGSFGYVTVTKVGGTCTGATSAMPAASCSPSSGTYTYTALAEEPAATCTIILRATDGGGLTSSDFTVTVTITEVNQTPAVAGDTAVSGPVGSPITVNVSATDADRPTALVQASVRVQRNGGTCVGTVVGLPTAYGAGSFTGTFTYTPAAGDGASCTVIYRACDQNGTPACSANRTLTVTVAAVNTAPTISGTAAITVAEGAISANLTVTGSDTDTCSGPGTNGYVTVSRIGGTCTGTVSALPTPSCSPSTGNYTYTALAEEPATTCTIILRATDGPGLTSPNQTVTVTITEVNQTPSVAGDTALSGSVGSPVTVNVSATDPDLPTSLVQSNVRVERNGGTCGGTVVGLPTAYGGGSFAGTFTYTPVVGDGSSCTILYRACDQNGTPACSANRTLTVTVTAANTNPTISGTTVITVAEGAQSANLTVTGSDIDTCTGPGSNGYVTVSRVGGTCLGALTALPTPSCSPSTGTYRYTAMTEEPATTCTILLRATDGKGAVSTNLTVTVTITEVNQAPTVSGHTTISGPIGTPIQFSVSGTDFDRPTSYAGSNVRVERNGGTCVGTLTGLPTAYGSTSISDWVYYTPAAGDGSSCTILYRACDQAGTPACSANRTLTVTVTCSHASPTVSIVGVDTKNVCRGACASYTFTVKNNDTGPNCSSETYNLSYPSIPPTGFSISGAPATVTLAAGVTSANQTLNVCANASASGMWSNMWIYAIAQSGKDMTGANNNITTVVDTTGPNRVSNFVAIAGDAAVNMTWTNTTDFAEVLIKRKTGSYPTSHTDATATTVLDNAAPVPGPASFNNNSGLVNGTTYFYAIYVKDACGNWNDQTVEGNNAYSATPQSATPDILTLASPGTQPLAGNIEQGAISKPVLRIRLTALSKSVTLTSLAVQNTGTAVNATDIAKVLFWTDDNNDGYITGETLLGQATWSTNKYLLSGMFFTVVSGTPRYIVVTVDIATAATNGRTITMLMDDNIAGTVTVQTPDTVDPITGFSGGMQTIIVPAIVGDGYLLRRDDQANEVAASGKIMCTSCHNLAIHNETITGSTYWPLAVWGSSFTCKTCHTAHKTTNIYLIKESISWSEANVKTITNASVVFRKRGIGDALNPPDPVAGGTVDYEMADSLDNDYRGICEVCHTVTTYHRNAAGEPDTSHQNAKDCTGCHPHDKGFKPGESGGGTTCRNCHGDIWSRINGTTTTTFSGAPIVTKHTIGSTANTNDSPNQAIPNATWNVQLSNILVANRSCTNMCHSDHPHDQMGTHQANIYKSSIDSTATHRGNATGDNNTDFDNTLAPNYGLCISCHQQNVDTNHLAISGANYDLSAHDFTTYSATNFYYQQHDNSQTLRNCTKCHHDPDDTIPTEVYSSTNPFAAVHFSRYQSLLFGNIRINNTQQSTAFVCYGCHGTGSAMKDLESIFGSNTGAPTGGRASKHPITSDSTHDTMTEYNAANLTGITRHVACADCHDPHEAQAGTYVAGGLAKIPRSPAISGIWGVTATLGAAGTPPNTGAVSYTKTAAITYEYELCLKCHSSYGWSTAPNTPSVGPNNQVWTETDVGRDFHSGNYGYHPLFAIGRNQPPVANGTNTTTNPPTSNPDWYTGGTNALARKKRVGGVNNGNNCTTDVFCDLSNTFVDGWRADSYVTCSDCHDNDVTTGVKGPHGSANKWILKGGDPDVTVTLNGGTVVYPNRLTSNWPGGWSNAAALNTANFCVNCHRRDVYGDKICNGAATAPHPNAQFMSRKVHQDSPSDFGCVGEEGTRFGIPCMNCHGGVSPGQIHGSNIGKGALPATCPGGSNCNRGWRFMNGSSWTAHQSDSMGGTCFTTGGSNDVTTCNQHSGGKAYSNVNYSYL